MNLERVRFQRNGMRSILGNTSHHANIIAFSSARWDQQALERNDIGHGLFTYAVVERIDRRADIEHKNVIRAQQLYDFVVKRLDALAKNFHMQQEPNISKDAMRLIMCWHAGDVLYV